MVCAFKSEKPGDEAKPASKDKQNAGRSNEVERTPLLEGRKNETERTGSQRRYNCVET